MKKSLLLLALISTTVSFSQTKKIYHKSHSGKSGTMFLDSKNNFGPGQAPVRYRTPESPVKLNKHETKKHEYPMVDIDTIKKIMKFIDMEDSVIGCNRNYDEYLSSGSIVYDYKKKDFFVYLSHLNVMKKHMKLFLKVTDSIPVWEKIRGAIRRNPTFIRDGNNHRILMYYPYLNYTLASNLIKSQEPKIEATPPIKTHKENEFKKKKKEEKISPKNKPQRPQPIASISEDEEAVILISTPSGNDTFILRWMGFLFFIFSIFIFVGVKRIVSEEIAKIKR